MSLTKPVLGLAVGGVLGLLDGLSGFLEPSLAPVMGSVITFSLLKGLLAGIATGYVSYRVHSMLGILAGIGIAADRRLLTHIARSLGYDVGIVYATAFAPETDPLLQAVLFFDQMRAWPQLDRKITLRGTLNRSLNRIIDQARYNFTMKPSPLRLGDAVIDQRHGDSLDEPDRAFVGRNLFESAHKIFDRTARFVSLLMGSARHPLDCCLHYHLIDEM